MKFIFLLSLLSLIACAPKQASLINGNTMGTTFSVKIVDEVKVEELKEEINKELRQVNQLMSTYIADSELSLFNQADIESPFPLSIEVIEVLLMAKQINQLSGGDFDITIGPLVNLWGFGPKIEDPKVPSGQDIQGALESIGMVYLEISPQSAIKGKDIYVDLSAIAKGYGVDQVAVLLDNKGVQNYLVEIGGELRAKGVNEKGNTWNIAIEKPDVSQRALFRAIELENMAMATSGDYRNYFEIDGHRYSHTISPNTGKPITHNVASVTVLHESTAMADGFATAINVMGADRGLAMAKEQDLAVLVILKTDDGFVERYSPKFKSLLQL